MAVLHGATTTNLKNQIRSSFWISYHEWQEEGEGPEWEFRGRHRTQLQDTTGRPGLQPVSGARARMQAAPAVLRTCRARPLRRICNSYLYYQFLMHLLTARACVDRYGRGGGRTDASSACGLAYMLVCHYVLDLHPHWLTFFNTCGLLQPHLCPRVTLRLSFSTLSSPSGCAIPTFVPPAGSR